MLLNFWQNDWQNEVQNDWQNESKIQNKEEKWAWTRRNKTKLHLFLLSSFDFLSEQVKEIVATEAKSKKLQIQMIECWVR